METQRDKLVRRWKWYAVFVLFFIYGAVQSLLKG